MNERQEALAIDLLEQARSALTSNMRCLTRTQFGQMQYRTAQTMINRIDEFLKEASNGGHGSGSE